MLKRIALIYFGVQFVSVSALGSMVLAQTTTTTPREGDFCVGIVEKLRKIDRKISDQRGELVKEGRDRLPRLEERWQKYTANLEEKRAQRDANLDQHFAKLEERAKTEVRNLSQNREQAVAAFKTAVLRAIDARRTAIDVALDVFHSGVKSALEARRAAIEKAFADRIAAFKAAAEKAKSDCLAGVPPKTVRAAFTSSLKSAQEKFAAAGRFNYDEFETRLKPEEKDVFRYTMIALQNDKKTAFRQAHDDFKAAIERAKTDLKKVFGEPNTTSTVSSITRIGVPAIVRTLCDQGSNQLFVTGDKYQATFQGKAVSALRSIDGKVWKIGEGAVTEGGTFYFDPEGKLLDICQLLFRPEGCERFAPISFDSKNYCSGD